jgi:mRNA-degrading endonuclease RelE of RelBE toxin-antitoxin system
MSTLAAEMPKKAETKRIEVHLMPEVVEGLKKLADKERRSLKNLCEYVLERYLQDNKKTGGNST